eukprot:329102_1
MSSQIGNKKRKRTKSDGEEPQQKRQRKTTLSIKPLLPDDELEQIESIFKRFVININTEHQEFMKDCDTLNKKYSFSFCNVDYEVIEIKSDSIFKNKIIVTNMATETNIESLRQWVIAQNLKSVCDVSIYSDGGSYFGVIEFEQEDDYMNALRFSYLTKLNGHYLTVYDAASYRQNMLLNEYNSFRFHESPEAEGE